MFKKVIKKWFTLMEMLVVVLIIWILMSLFLLKVNHWEEPFKIEMVKFFNSVYLSIDNFPFDKKSDSPTTTSNKVENAIIKLDEKWVVDYQYYTYKENKDTLWNWFNNTNKIISLWKEKSELYYNDANTIFKYKTSYWNDLEEWKSWIVWMVWSNTILELDRCILNESDINDPILITNDIVKKWFFVFIDRKWFYYSETLNSNIIDWYWLKANEFSSEKIVPIDNLSCWFKVDSKQEWNFLVRFF